MFASLFCRCVLRFPHTRVCLFVRVCILPFVALFCCYALHILFYVRLPFCVYPRDFRVHVAIFVCVAFCCARLRCDVLRCCLRWSVAYIALRLHCVIRLPHLSRLINFTAYVAARVCVYVCCVYALIYVAVAVPVCVYARCVVVTLHTLHCLVVTVRVYVAPCVTRCVALRYGTFTHVAARLPILVLLRVTHFVAFATFVVYILRYALPSILPLPMLRCYALRRFYLHCVVVTTHFACSLTRFCCVCLLRYILRGTLPRSIDILRCVVDAFALLFYVCALRICTFCNRFNFERSVYLRFTHFTLRLRSLHFRLPSLFDYVYTRYVVRCGLALHVPGYLGVGGCGPSAFRYHHTFTYALRSALLLRYVALRCSLRCCHRRSLITVNYRHTVRCRCTRSAFACVCVRSTRSLRLRSLPLRLRVCLRALCVWIDLSFHTATRVYTFTLFWVAAARTFAPHGHVTFCDALPHTRWLPFVRCLRVTIALLRALSNQCVLRLRLR